MSELIHCPSTFMSVSLRPIFCAVRGGPCRTPAQPSAATSAALPYLRKTAKIRRSSGGPRLSRPREGWADARERDPPVSPQNPSPASDRDKRGPPVSSQNRKDSPVFGNAALPYLRKTAKIRRFSGGPRLSRPREEWADARERGPPVSSQNRKDSPVFGRAALVAAGRGGGRTRGSASLPRAASGG